MGFDSHRLLYSLYFSPLLRAYKNNYSLNTYEFHLQSVELARDADKWKILQTHQILLLCPSLTESRVMRILPGASHFRQTKANKPNLSLEGKRFIWSFSLLQEDALQCPAGSLLPQQGCGDHPTAESSPEWWA